MKRLLPSHLFGQMLLILLGGLVLSHAIGAWVYSSDREAAVRAVGGLATAQRIANLTHLVEDAPVDWRGRIIASLSDQNFRVTLTSQRPQLPPGDAHGAVADAIRGYLVERLALGPERQPLVAAALPDAPPFGFGPARYPIMMHRPSGMMMDGPGGGMMMGGPGLLGLAVAIPLHDGQWLSFDAAVANAGPAYSYQFIIAMIVMALVIVVASIWATRRVTAPLTARAGAAERLGQDVNAPPIPETGSIETRQASRAFNEMQVRLRELIENRTRLLAAISHDLRTPLTLLRLRAENVPDAEEREKMLSTLADMDAMVGATLAFARDEMTSEPARRADLTALVESIVHDMADAGRDVALAPAKQILLECRPTALKRAITNLIDNALKYGKKAQVTIASAPKMVEITVDDEGPGIPEQELARVFQPFYRVEGSRSRETGGVGLGLAIAKSLIERHQGTLTLSNRAGGGLRARIALPA
jgi:signal transduction histidine kinase